MHVAISSAPAQGPVETASQVSTLTCCACAAALDRASLLEHDSWLPALPRTAASDVRICKQLLSWCSAAVRGWQKRRVTREREREGPGTRQKKKCHTSQKKTAKLGDSTVLMQSTSRVPRLWQSTRALRGQGGMGAWGRTAGDQIHPAHAGMPLCDLEPRRRSRVQVRQFQNPRGRHIALHAAARQARCNILAAHCNLPSVSLPSTLESRGCTLVATRLL